MKQFPSSFESEIYRKSNVDLISFSKEELFDHYIHIGKSEGLICSEIQSEDDFVDLISLDGRTALEIAPLDNPRLTSIFDNVKYLDLLSKKKLIEKYNSDPNVNKESIVNINYVWNGEKYSDIIPEIFDSIFAAHVIEHTPNLVDFYENVSSVLKTGGYLFLMIPDKRYCFDFFKPQTTLYDILYANMHKNKKPTFQMIIEHLNNGAHNDAKRHWDGDNGDIAIISDDYEKSLSQYVDEIKDLENNYHDVHVWKFIPKNFSYISNYLFSQKLTDLKLIRLYPTVINQFQFFAILQKI